MIDRERLKLLFGPYKAPRLRRRDRAFCLFRDCDVVITSWTDARISWPRCRALDVGRSAPGLLVNEEMARAIRSESAVAIRHWWKVSTTTVAAWRRALGVGRADPEGSRRLIRAAAELGASKIRGKRLPSEQVERRRHTAIALNLGRHLVTGFHGPWWTPKELALLGTYPDNVIARRVGRTVTAVRLMRTRLGIPTRLDRRKARDKEK